MPTLHETTRKRICRIGFFLLCLAPTVATGGWIGSHYWPGAHQRLETALAERLRVTPKLSPRETPKPGLTRFSSATLAGFAAAQQVELRQSKGLRVVQIEKASLQLESLPELLKVAQREWESPTAQPHLIRINELGIASHEAQSGGETIQLRKFRIQLDDSGPEGLRRVRLAAHVGEEGTEVSAIVQQQADGTWKAKLDASQTALPVRLLAGFAPVLRNLGGQFLGKIQWNSAGNEVAGLVQGKITGNELRDYLPRRFRHDATGEATVVLEDLSFAGDQIQKLVGTLHVGEGELSAQLFGEIEKILYCRPNPENLATPGIQPQQTISFDRLAVRMVFDEKGFSLWGDLPDDSGRIDAPLMVRNGKALLLQPAWVDFSVGYWVQFAIGDTPTAMPVSREAIELARRLPTPANVKAEK